MYHIHEHCESSPSLMSILMYFHLAFLIKYFIKKKKRLFLAALLLLRRLSLVVASRGYSSLWCWPSHCSGFSGFGAQAVGARPSFVVAHRLDSCRSQALELTLSCSKACGIFLDQGLNPCPGHWQADFYH